MTAITRIQCKDCPEWFTYSDEAARQDRLLGRTPPERCPACRPKHRKEYQSLGVSHYDVLQIRTDGAGGLATYERDRAEPKIEQTQHLDITPFPIEDIIGSADKPDTILHGLLRDSRRIHLVVGPTGSGKSTWLPFRLLTCQELVAKGPIVITEPRIPAVVETAKFVGKMYYGDTVENPIGPGLVIGYRHSEVGSTRMDSANRMIFMTDGTLLNWIQTGEVRRYSVVMIDEAHERSVNIDKILTLLRFKLSRFPHLQVIIASATVDSEAFLNYFGGPDHVAVYTAKGFTYPILEVFADETVAFCPDLWADPAERSKLWERVPSQTLKEKLLGPEPCWTYRHSEAYRLRYYPTFESLIFQGVMSSPEKEKLLAQCRHTKWVEAIQGLARQSTRKRRIDETATIPITDSIRGIKQKAKTGKPVQASKKSRDRAIYATVDAVMALIERDQQEASHRRDRWGKWEQSGRQKPEKPLPVGHILAFLPSVGDINKCADLINEELERRGWQKDNVVLRYFKYAPEQEKQQVTADTRGGQGKPLRKIVIGSNLAETSLTLDGVIYVVDSGLICEEYFDPNKGKWVPAVLHSQAGCRQRMGRVGRKEPGEAYRLYTRTELLGQASFTTPEIARSSAESVILDLVRAGFPLDRVRGALMNPPKPEEITRSLGELTRFEAIDADGDVTHIGEELATTWGESLLNKKLLCEADRFGVLWEMAVFLAFINLKDCEAPPLDGPLKWLGLWEPTDQVVYEDADDQEHDVPFNRKEGRSVWDNPYVAGNTLIKRNALIEGCLDDLELYLRLWQGWYSQNGDDARRQWAHEYSVNHEALKKVEEELFGSEEKPGPIRNHWAIEQKGSMRRDINFFRLDLVRFLYAAGFPDNVYKRDDKRDDKNVFCKPQEQKKQRPSFLHQESVWHPPAGISYHRLNEKVDRTYCVATPKGPGQHGVFLRHIVWVAPEWIREENALSFHGSPVSLARRFSDIADRAHFHQGEAPFLHGSEKAGFRWPMPSIPIPTPLQIEQWRTTLRSMLAQSETREAEVSHLVYHPHICGRRIVFVQIPRGPLVPLDTDAVEPGGLQIGRTLSVHLTFKEGLIWACPEQPVKAPPEPVSESRAVSAVEDASPEDALPVQKPVEAPRKGPSNVIPMRKPTFQSVPPVAQVKPPPKNMILDAEVKDIIIKGKPQGFIARVTTAPYTDHEVIVACPLSEATLRKEASIGRGLKFRVMSMKKERIAGRFIEWKDGARPLDITDDWPVGTQVEAQVVELHKKHEHLVWVRIRGFEAKPYEWLADVKKGRVPAARPDRKMMVEVIKWNTGQGPPRPFLKFLKWLD